MLMRFKYSLTDLLACTSAGLRAPMMCNHCYSKVWQGASCHTDYHLPLALIYITHAMYSWSVYALTCQVALSVLLQLYIKVS